MKLRSLILLLLFSVILGAALTGFYFVHESLPRAIRAPTSLILTPVAVIDGLCYAIGIPGIYGRPVPVLLVNSAFGFVLYCGGLGVRRWWAKRKVTTQDRNTAQQQ